MSVTIILLYLTYFSVYVIVYGSIFIDGPADITFHWIRDCQEYKNKNLPIKFSTLIHKLNRTQQVVDVNASLPFALDRTVSIKVSSERWGAGGWMKNAFSMKEPNVCIALNNCIGDLWFEIEENIGLVPKKCPIPAGRYYSKDTVIDPQKMAVQTFIQGQFKTKVKLYKSKKLVLCKEFNLELKEKLPYT